MGREGFHIRDTEPLPSAAAPEGQPLQEPLRTDKEGPHGQEPQAPQETA